MSDLVADIAEAAGCSAVIGQSEAVMSLSVVDVPAEVAFRAVAAAAEVGVRFEGGVVQFVGEIGDLSESVCVVRAGFAAPDEAEQAYTQVVGSGAHVTAVGDRIVVAGSVAAVEAAVELESRLARGPDGWLLDVCVWSVSRSWAERIGVGLDVGARLEVGADAGVGNIDGAVPVLGAAAKASVAALFAASESGQDVRLERQGTLYLLEGTTAEMQDGSTIPVPRRTVSPEGTVTTTGFDFVRTGFLLTVTGRRVGDSVLLELEPSVSAVIGAVDGHPIVSESTASVSAVVGNGGWVMVTGLRSRARSESSAGAWGVGVDEISAQEGDAWVAVRATRIFSQ